MPALLTRITLLPLLTLAGLACASSHGWACVPQSVNDTRGANGRSTTPANITLVLKERVEVAHSVVRLDDLLAELSAPASVRQSWLALELFPTPLQATRFSAREIRERLALRGIDPYYLNLAGATSILIAPVASQRTSRQANVQTAAYQTNAAPQANNVHTSYRLTDRSSRGDGSSSIARPEVARLHNTADREAAEKRVRELVIETLHNQSRTSIEWEAEVTVPPAHAQLLANPAAKLSLLGFHYPWIGEHELKVRVTQGVQTKLVSLQVTVESLTYAVVSKAPISTGDIVQASMLELAPVDGRSAYNDLVFRMEDVVGREAKRPIRRGQQIRADVLQQPIVVKRGQVVMLRVSFGQSFVQRPVRAKQDGAIGDLIKAETLDRAGEFIAQVTEGGSLQVMPNAIPSSNISRSASQRVQVR